jgi:hypothetical protein
MEENCMKKVKILLMVALFIVCLGSTRKITAADNSYYGLPINGYTIVDQESDTDNNRILGTGNIIRTYYTYYAYDDLGTKFINLGDDYFSSGSNVVGEFTRTFIFSSVYTMSNSIGYSIVMELVLL